MFVSDAAVEGGPRRYAGLWVLCATREGQCRTHTGELRRGSHIHLTRRRWGTASILYEAIWRKERSTEAVANVVRGSSRAT